MAGLLDFINTPEGQGLLAGAFGGLAGARRGTPFNNVGRAGMAGLLGYGNAQERLGLDADKQFKLAQQARQKQEWAKSDKIDGLAAQYMLPGQSAMPATPGTAGVNSALPPDLQIGALPGMPARQATAPRFDATGYGQALMGIDPTKGVAFQQSMAKDTPFNKLDVKDFTPESVRAFSSDGGRNYALLQPRTKMEVNAATGQVFDPFNIKAGTVMRDPNKPFGVGDDGSAVPNMPFQAFELSKAKSGAARTDIRIDNKMGEGLAKEIGPMLKDSASAADGAVKQIYAADQITKAVDSNKMYAGTGAGIRLTAAQVADTLGLGGNTTSEKIANTRQTVQGLAQLTLQGRQQMRGQGAITESESKLAERAVSGDISMTPAEIKQLAAAAKRSAMYVQSEHQRKLGVVKNDPNLSKMAPFYDVTPMTDAPTQAITPTYRYVDGKLQKVN